MFDQNFSDEYNTMHVFVAVSNINKLNLQIYMMRCNICFCQSAFIMWNNSDENVFNEIIRNWDGKYFLYIYDIVEH